jgi:hypothetical protein
MNVYDYIKQYAKANGIKNYALKCKYLTKSDMANTLHLSGGVAFFYRIIAEGEIISTADIAKSFLQVSTPEFWDLSPVVEITDFGTIQKVSTDFIFSADNMVNFTLFEGTSNAMFNSITNLCILYMQLIPLNESGEPEPLVKVNVKY